MAISKPKQMASTINNSGCISGSRSTFYLSFNPRTAEDLRRLERLFGAMGQQSWIERNNSFHLRYTNHDASRVLKKALPYLDLKKERAAKVLIGAVSQDSTKRSHGVRLVQDINQGRL